MSRAVRTLYRLFLRQANRLEREGRTLEARMPVDKEAWLQNGGAHGWATPAPGAPPPRRRQQLWQCNTLPISLKLSL